MKFDHYLNRSNNFFSTLYNSFQYLAPYLDRIHRTLPIFSWSMTDILYIRQFFTYGNFINRGKSKMCIICGFWISPNVSFRAVCSSSGNTFEWNGDSNSSSTFMDAFASCATTKGIWSSCPDAFRTSRFWSTRYFPFRTLAPVAK